MKEHYYDKKKVLWHYVTLMFITLVAFGGMSFQIRDVNHVYVYGPFVLYGLYLVASIFRRVRYQNPVVIITAGSFIIDRINAAFYHRPIEIMFSEIKYISTDILKKGKVFFVKTNDESEYKFSLAMLDATHEEIVAELKRYHTTLIDGGVFEIEEDSSLNMD